MKFSIVIAVFNAGKTLRTATESVLQQDYSDFEVILINDGSQDESGEICLELQALDRRIRYIEFACNKGLGHVRNYGIQAAEGEYIVFLDADDTLEPNALTTCYDSLKKELVDILVVGFFEDYNNGKEKQRLSFCKLPGHRLYLGHDAICGAVIRLIRLSEFCFSWNKLYRRRFLIDAGITFSLYPYIEDILMNLEAFSRCTSVMLIDVPLYHYNKTVQFSLTTRYEANFLTLHQYLMDKEVTYFSKENQLKQALPILTCQYLKLVFTAFQMTFYKDAPPQSMLMLLHEVFRSPHFELFMSYYSCLPFKYRLLGHVLNSQSFIVIYIVSYFIYVMKHKLLRLWCAVK